VALFIGALVVVARRPVGAIADAIQ